MNYEQRPRTFDLTRRDREKQKMGGLRPRKPKEKRWSHQDDLEALKGKGIILNLNDGSSYTGILIDADQFTLKIQVENVSSAITVFKSVMTDYRGN
jgi:small nuclear ribonucleoprotein (snRNP)-like protein